MKQQPVKQGKGRLRETSQEPFRDEGKRIITSSVTCQSLAE